MTSSDKCAIELIPVPRLRALVMTSGCLFLAIGLAIIGHLPIPAVAKIALAGVWIADCVFGLRRQARGNARVHGIRIDVRGVAQGLDEFSKPHKIQILKGSAVLQRWAWLRLRFADGSHYVELWRRKDCPPTTWRRLQLIWRHAL